jgi:hypothetical protein
MPEIRVIAGLPLAYVRDSGDTIPVAASLITTCTVAPHRRSEWMSLTISTAAMLPVTATITCFPARE